MLKGGGVTGQVRPFTKFCERKYSRKKLSVINGNPVRKGEQRAAAGPRGDGEAEDRAGRLHPHIGQSIRTIPCPDLDLSL